jgi:hypothetical protein
MCLPTSSGQCLQNQNDKTATQGSERWKELLGLTGASIRWGYVAAFLVATLVSGLSSTVVQEVLWTRGAGYFSIPLTVLALESIRSTLVVLCIVMGFRFLRPWAAVVFTPFAYAILAYGADAVHNSSSAGGEMSVGVRPWALAAISAWLRYFFIVLFLLGVILALRWMRSTWVALPLGAWVGSCAAVAPAQVGHWLLLRGSWRPTGLIVHISVVPFIFWRTL